MQGIFIKSIANTAKHLIIRLEECKDLGNEEKKARLDDEMAKYVEQLINCAGFNFITKTIIKKVVLKNIPHITQAVFDLIKAKVEGITK